MSNAAHFAKVMAFKNTFYLSGTPADYGLKTYVELFDLITGDTSFSQLPLTLREELRTVYDLESVAEDLRDGYSFVMYVLRGLANDDDRLQILEEVLND